jgi:hypothetical protein
MENNDTGGLPEGPEGLVSIQAGRVPHEYPKDVIRMRLATPPPSDGAVIRGKPPTDSVSKSQQSQANSLPKGKLGS